MIKQLPNFVTCLNLLSGCFGLILLFNGDAQAAAYCIWASAVFDFFDGFVARAVNAQSPMGKELDSLADVISFGVLPAFLWFLYLAQSRISGISFSEASTQLHLPFLALLMAAFSAWRLAKFNIDDRQTDHFRGVPTPANALVWSAIPFISSTSLFPWTLDWINNTWFVTVFGLLMCVLLVSDLPLIAFKFKQWSWAANKIKYSFLILTVGLLAILGANAIFFVLFLYLGASFLENKSKVV